MNENVSVRFHRAAVSIAVAGALFGLAGCGNTGSANPAPESSVAGNGATQEASEQPSEQATGGNDAPAPTELTGEPLPDDWPSDILVPGGQLVLVLQIGTGYSLTVEGVDSEQAQGLIGQMASAGLTTEGPTPTGVGEEWTASATSATHTATYAYAGGGAGLPNVAITLLPKP